MASGNTTQTTAQSTTHSIAHNSIIFPIPGLPYTTTLESTLGRWNSITLAIFHNLTELEARVNTAYKGFPLGIFTIYGHGVLSTPDGKPARARRYLIGSPVFAAQMDVHHVRAGLYAPMSVLVWEQEGRAVVEWDSMEDLERAVAEGDEDVLGVARRLDRQLREVLEIVLKKATEGVRRETRK